MDDKNKEKERRKRENQNIITRLREGDPLNSIDPQATHFPPRPIIKKNKNDIEKLYGITGVVTDDKTTNDKPSG